MESPNGSMWLFDERECRDRVLEAVDGVTYEVVAVRLPPAEEGDDPTPTDEFLVVDPAGGHRHIAYDTDGRLVMNKPCFLPM